MSKAANLSGSAVCLICENDGYVELKGTRRVLGIDYPRGMAPCKWCELGARNFERLSAKGKRPESDFDIEDVDTPSEPPPKNYREIGRRELPKLKERMGVIGRSMDNEE